MSVVMRILGLTSGGNCPLDGQYLVEYDPNRPGVDPDGHSMLAHIVCSSDIAQAKVFANSMECIEEWRRAATAGPIGPIRPDGKPNRPLTAFNITPETSVLN